MKISTRNALQGAVIDVEKGEVIIPASISRAAAPCVVRDAQLRRAPHHGGEDNSSGAYDSASITDAATDALKRRVGG